MSLISSFKVIGFCGSRSAELSPVVRLVLGEAWGFVSPGSSVLVGDSTGVDLATFSHFSACSSTGLDLSVSLFRVGDFPARSRRGAFALRSSAFVSAIAEGGGLLVAVPCRSCPAGVVPSARFFGGGSGTWGSVALAAFLGVPCLVWLARGSVPRWVGFSWSCVGNPVFGGSWWLCSSSSSSLQLSLF
jgi:hypothetical protein